jgi:hypothetical protein
VLKDELLSSLCVRRASFKKWRQTFQTTSLPKPHGRSPPNFTEMILWWSPLKIVQSIYLHAELCLPWQPKEKTLNIIFF